MGHWKRGPKWKSPVPYKFGWRTAADSGLVNMINDAIAEYERCCNVKFVYRTDQKEYIFFVRKGKKKKKLKKEGGLSDIGKGGGDNGKTRVRLGKKRVSKSLIMHEIGHALGLFHEQQRRDRDDYVDIFWKNIIKSQKFNFKMTPKGKGRRLGVYDIDSIMQYDSDSYSKNGEPTIKKKNGDTIPYHSQLTPTDIETINKIVH